MKEEATYNYEGKRSFGSLLCTWAERRRVLAAELRSGSASDKPIAPRLVLRALRTLPRGHGEVRLRADSGFYSAGFLNWCRGHRLRFCVVVPHYQVMWELRRHISPSGWRPCREMAGAEVAELRFTPTGWQHEPLRLTAFIEAPQDAMDRIIAGNEALGRLVNNRWLAIVQIAT
ncbi:MAG: putative inorganic carbon transporter subunit DabA, partial [Candidatus Dormibacteria bacterium]